MSHVGCSMSADRGDKPAAEPGPPDTLREAIYDVGIIAEILKGLADGGHQLRPRNERPVRRLAGDTPRRRIRPGGAGGAIADAIASPLLAPTSRLGLTSRGGIVLPVLSPEEPPQQGANQREHLPNSPLARDRGCKGEHAPDVRIPKHCIDFAGVHVAAEDCIVRCRSFAVPII
jgi:hypothetical protein